MKFPFQDGKPVGDLRGENVTFRFGGDTRLGMITAIEEHDGIWFARVRFFNGDPWPIKPRVDRLHWLKRDWPAEES